MLFVGELLKEPLRDAILFLRGQSGKLCDHHI